MRNQTRIIECVASSYFLQHIEHLSFASPKFHLGTMKPSSSYKIDGKENKKQSSNQLHERLKEKKATELGTLCLAMHCKKK